MAAAVPVSAVSTRSAVRSLLERQSLLSAVLLAFLVFALARPLGAQSLYWENALRLSRGAGSYPQATLAGPAGSQRVTAVWQEYESGQEINRAWLSLASYGRDGQTTRSRFAGPFSFSGSIPVLFSTAVDRNGRLAIALASEPGKAQVLYSDDGGLSFSESVSVPLAENAVSPRIFPRAAGGWYIFVTVGSDFDFALSYTWTDDGTNWQPLQLFVPPESGLRQTVLPSAAALNGRDYVLFQSFSGGGERTTNQLYSMVSSDGGLSWSTPQRVTDFTEPVLRDRPNPDDYSNQRVHLRPVGNELWYAWERQPTGGGRWQLYLARLDESGRTMAGTASRVSLDQGNVTEPRLFSIEGNIAVSWSDDRRGSPRVYMSVRDGLLWRETDLSGRAGGSGTFGRAVYLDGGLYAFWQSGELATASIIGLIPDTTVQAPRLTPVDFRDGVRIRRDRASVRWTTPADSSGIQGYSWLWTRNGDEEPPEDIMLLQDETALTRTADDDGEWYFAVRARDYAGNWSATERVAFVRDTTPPGLPLPLPPQTGPDNFLSANTFSLRWQAPDDPDVAGYAWRLDMLGPLDRLPARKRPAETAVQLSAADREAAGLELSATAVSGTASSAGAYPWQPITPYEEGLWTARGLPLPAPAIRSTAAQASFNNIDDGYYVFTVQAVDSVGNIGEPLRFILRADKFRPFTLVSDLDDTRDDFGNLSLRLFGRGFLDDGAVTRIVLDLDGREPYDRDYLLADRAYTIVNDRLVTGLEAIDLSEGNYRIGVYHPVRGWLFTRPLVEIDVSGTVKFGPRAVPWQPDWVFPATGTKPVHAATLFMIVAMLFSALGLLLSTRQLVALYRESLFIRDEARAIIEGKPMPKLQKEKILKRGVNRGGLTLKFAFTISFLVLFVVALVSIPIGVQVLDSQSATLANGLDQLVKVLLESMRQGTQSNLPGGLNNIINLIQLPRQASAMQEVGQVIISGYAAGGSTSADAVWATKDPEDPDLQAKIDTAELDLGYSIYTDSLSELLPGIIESINSQAALQVSEVAAALQAIADELPQLGLRTDEASVARLNELSAKDRELREELERRLSEIADASISSIPQFDPGNLGLEPQTYLFYKPVLYRVRGQETFYRGMVRMEVSTELIVAEVLKAREALLRSVAIVAAIALGAGIVGSIVLAGIIINPIRRIVRGIEHIRDTEDKKLLAEYSIDIKTKDELSVLAQTINEMTSSLVHAAQEADFLTVGKEVQKMFIPLIKNSSGEKLTTGVDERETHSFFGYYEGAKGVSGDYFDYRQLDERYWAFVKCDVAGKGIPAALIMVGVATIFATEFQGWSYKVNGIKLDKVVYKINDFIEERGFKGRFAAFIMGVYDCQTGAAYLCNAGDNLLRQYVAEDDKIITHTLPSSPTAGTFSNDLVEMKAPFQQVVKKLAVNDILLLYTDGFEESSRARRTTDYKQIMERKIMTDREGKETIHMEPGVEQLGEERIQEVAAAILNGGSYTLVKENDPLGPGTEYHFDFASATGTVEEVVMGIAAVEKVFRMIPDPSANENDSIMVDAKIDAMLSKHFKEYELYCRHRKPHPDPRRSEYLFYTHLSEDDQYDDLTMMVIKRNK